MLTSKQLFDYHRDGFLKLPALLDRKEVKLVKAAIEQQIESGGPSLVFEKDAFTVRALHGSHKTNRVLANLCRLRVVCSSAHQIIGEPIYVYQFKINFKHRLSGKSWPWHRDFTFWQNEDGMVAPVPVTVAILIDEATDQNGPLCFVPRSHMAEVSNVEAPAQESDWHSHVASDLKYKIPDEEVSNLAKDSGIEPFVGPEGSAVLFHSKIIHGSKSNRSPLSRRMIFITYNGMSNTPVQKLAPRPAFLVEPRPQPIQVLDMEKLYCC